MVEAGRIDHAHHEGNAVRALNEAVELSRAVERAAALAGDDTLILVTADHSHTIFMAGYPVRGNPILGLVVTNGEDGRSGEGADDRHARPPPYTTLGYGSGPGGVAGPRADLTGVDTQAPDFKQQALIPMSFGGARRRRRRRLRERARRVARRGDDGAERDLLRHGARARLGFRRRRHARDAAGLRVLRPGSAAGFGGRPDLHVRMHVLRGLRPQAPGNLSQLRRGARPSPDPSRGEAGEVSRFDEAGLQARGLRKARAERAPSPSAQHPDSSAPQSSPGSSGCALG